MALMRELVDSFNGGINTSLWTASSGQVVAVGGVIRINHTAVSEYNDYNADAVRDLTGNYARVKIPNVGNQALTSHEVVFLLDKNYGGNNQLLFYVTGGNLFAYKTISGTQTLVGSSATYNPASHKWLGFSESGGTTYWDTSPDGITWTHFASVANPFGITDMVPIFRCGNWQNEAVASYADFENFNTTGAIAPVVAGDTENAALLNALGAYVNNLNKVEVVTSDTSDIIGATVPPDAKGVWLMRFIGAGGGGGSGRSGATSTNRNGGGGGAGGGTYDGPRFIPAALLGATYDLNVGPRGAGGSGITAATVANGNPGTDGGDAIFASGAITLGAGGGGGGAGGTTAAAAGGIPDTVPDFQGAPGGQGLTNTIAPGGDSPTIVTAGVWSYGGAGGGGGGVGINSSNAYGAAGGAGGTTPWGTGGAGGVAGVSVPGTGSAALPSFPGAGAGGGATANPSLAVQAGATAAGYGGGGGGGSGSTSTAGSGAGGDGGAGYACIMWVY